jgi:ketosteroid isomerase-like protein
VSTSTNLDLVRSLYADWERGDYFSRGDWAHPEIEFLIIGGPEPGNWTGLSGMARGFRAWLDAWVDLQTKVKEFRSLSDERVLVFGYMSGRGKTSGVEVKMGFVNVLDIRDGKVVRLCLYGDRDRALADLGVTLEGDTP